MKSKASDDAVYNSCPDIRDKVKCDLQGRIQDFTKVGAGAERPKFFFRTQAQNSFATPPLFAFLPFWTNFKKKFALSTYTNPLFAFLPFWTNFNFAHTHESGTEQGNLGGQADRLT